MCVIFELLFALHFETCIFTNYLHLIRSINYVTCRGRTCIDIKILFFRPIPKLGPIELGCSSVRLSSLSCKGQHLWMESHWDLVVGSNDRSWRIWPQFSKTVVFRLKWSLYGLSPCMDYNFWMYDHRDLIIGSNVKVSACRCAPEKWLNLAKMLKRFFSHGLRSKPGFVQPLCRYWLIYIVIYLFV